MKNKVDRKPRFTRIVRGDGLWLRDRKLLHEGKDPMVGPFASLADAIAHEKAAADDDAAAEGPG